MKTVEEKSAAGVSHGTGAVLELEHVTKEYEDFALKDVTFAVPTGCICGFIGQNGAGKTTTIQLILDIVKKNGGDIRIFGGSMEQQGAALKNKIGVVYDEMCFHEFLTAKQINTMMKNIYAAWEEETFFRYLKEFSLPLKKRCGAFSRGMRMKLQIAVALSHGAELLIMDEPTSGLDPIVRNEILQIFQEYVLEENHTIFLSSHITGDLERIADMVVFIDKGKIVLAGNKNEILESHGLLKCKKGDLEKIEQPDMVASRQSAFCTEVLVKDRKKCEEKYCSNENTMVMESCGLEEIMLFYINAANDRRHI